MRSMDDVSHGGAQYLPDPGTGRALLRAELAVCDTTEAWVGPGGHGYCSPLYRDAI